MKIKFVKSTYNWSSFDTENLFHVCAEDNKVILFGRDGANETVALPDGVDANVALAAINAGIANGSNTVFVFFTPSGKVETHLDGDEFSVLHKGEEDQAL